MVFPAPRIMTPFAAVMCCGLLAIACDTSNSGMLTAPTAAGLPTSFLTIGDGPTVGTGQSISQGQTVRSAVEFSDSHPPCFRNWDASGRCNQFDIVAPQDGTLSVRVLWQTRPGAPPDNVDLFVVEPRGWYASYGGDREASLIVSVTAGSTYHILVMSYRLPQDFELRVALRGSA